MRRCRRSSPPAATATSPTTSSRYLRAHARQSSLGHLRDRAAADRPHPSPAHKQSDPTLYAGVVKERDDGIVISGAQQLATGGVFSDCHPSELHPSAAAGRRELRQRRRHSDQCAGREALSAPAVRAQRRPTRSTIRCRAASTRPTASSCSTTCSCPGSTSSSTATWRSAATSGGRRRRISTATIRRRRATPPSCAS